MATSLNRKASALKKNLWLLFLISIVSARGYSEGVYIEFLLKTGGGITSSLVTYTRGEDTRSETSFSFSKKVPGMISTKVSLILKEQPGVIYLLDSAKKSYTEMDTSKSGDMKDHAIEDYTVTVIGKEKVNGYNTIHVNIKTAKTEIEQDMWLTTEIKDFADFLKVKTKYTGKQNLNKALAAKGATGFPVRIQIIQKGGGAIIDLVKAEKSDNPPSLFSLEGYTKAGGAQNAEKDMMQKLEKMSPEERKKFIEDMNKQYGNQPK